jgi:hypothetical protein
MAVLPVREDDAAEEVIPPRPGIRRFLDQAGGFSGVVELLRFGESGETEPKMRRRIADAVFFEERFREAALREVGEGRPGQLTSIVLRGGV